MDKSSSISATYGCYTFTLDEIQKRLPRPIFEAIKSTIAAGEPLDMGFADEVAHAMKEWGVEHGATHYTHWFQPLTGATAEKHDAFLELSGGRPIERFSGSQLIQAEPDASSFPSGGIRSTFEARGYTAWDPTSPAFLIYNEHGATLTIPSVFVSYTGEALDKKTPLLRSMRELNRAARATLELMGHPTSVVHSTLGAEQEYFLIDRHLFHRRPDLEVTGRTILGTTPPKGQQLEDNYFGSIDDRALDFMGEVESEAWKLGIPVKTRHNEVAPHQYEAAPIFQATNLSCDQNQMLMDLMRKVARRRNLAVLFHEKPFAGVNGSGKHNNWSMSTAEGRNLLDPGATPNENVEFLYFLAAALQAVHKRGDLLRASVASAGNDHRLGANEAPPAIISVFLGTRLTEILDTLLAGKSIAAVQDQVIQTGLEVLPQVKKDNTDRNRTSPFAFTGNKFEFRAVGSSQSSSMSMAYLNVAVAEALDGMWQRLKARLDGGEDRTEAILAVVRDVYAACQPIVFNGNNYAQAWVDEAARRGLPNTISTPAALLALTSESAKTLLSEYGIFQPHEVDARYTILLEQYNRMLDIEAVQMIRMAKTGILPAAYAQQATMADAYAKVSSCGIKADVQREELGVYTGMIEETLTAIDGVRQALKNAPDEHAGPEKAEFQISTLRPAMGRLRTVCDALERRTDEELWPFPSYHALLFQ
ncbi:MAG: glutamine synthetase III [Planctomycetota bacterium]|nr:glutamine synthetase III [Planctomycetota bacterium]